MAFIDLDPIETQMGVRVEDMDADSLLNYFKRSQQEVNDIEAVIRPFVDFRTFEQLIKEYPQPRAGRIVKWLFYKHKGKATWDGRKQVVRVPHFSTPWRWMVEQWWTQVQMDLKREERKLKGSGKSSRFMSISEL